MVRPGSYLWELFRKYFGGGREERAIKWRFMLELIDSFGILSYLGAWVDRVGLERTVRRKKLVK